MERRSPRNGENVGVVASLRGSDLQGAKYGGITIEKADVLSGLYAYVVIPIIDDKGTAWVRMGCFFRTIADWDFDFWNNPSEFPNDGSVKSELRLAAYQFAKKWIEIYTNR